MIKLQRPRFYTFMDYTTVSLILISYIYRRDMKPKNYIILTISVFVLLLHTESKVFSQTNEGVEFWMTFMQHRDIQNNSMVVLITSRTNTSGTVSIPLRGFSAPFTVAENSVTQIRMPAYAETIGSEQIDNNAIQVTSLDPVSVYIHQYQDFHAEASIVLPVSSISNTYYVMSYEGINRNPTDDGASEFIVVGIEDETTVNINLTDNTKQGLRQGDDIQVVLDRGETYQVRALDTERDLTGSFVSADKNISVFAGSSYSGVPKFCGNRDNLLEQMYPVTTMGNQYVTAPTRSGYDVFRILAIEDATEIIILDENGNEEEVRLDKAEFYEYQRSVPTLVSNKNPDDKRGFMLAQFLVGSECIGEQFGGPSMVILSSVEQIRETVTVFNSSLEDIRENYISIICQTDDVDGIMRNGQAITSNWRTIGNEKEFSFTVEPVNAGNHTITSSGCGVIAMAYGFGQFEGYAYFGGASFNEINGNPLPDGECVGNPVHFESGLPPRRYDVEWTTELGDTIFDHEFDLDFPDDDEGQYLVKLKTFDNCFLVLDSLEKIVRMTYQAQSIAGDEQIIICEDQLLELSVESLPNATYEWFGPGEYSSEDQNPAFDVDPSNSGEYEVKATIFGCIAAPDFVNVGINPLPEPDLGLDSVYCGRLGIPHTLQAGNFDSYQWSDGSQNQSLDILTDGIFSVTVTDQNNCSASDDIEFGSQCPTAIYIPTAFTPNGDGTNDFFEVSAFDVTSYELQIFDRWGNLVFITQDEDYFWDGRFKGEQAAGGVYVWIIKYSGFDVVGDGISKTEKGTVTLVR